MIKIISKMMNVISKKITIIYIAITMLFAIILTAYITRQIDKKECLQKVKSCELSCKKANEEQKMYYLQSFEKKPDIDDIYISIELNKLEDKDYNSEVKNDVGETKNEAKQNMTDEKVNKIDNLAPKIDPKTDNLVPKIPDNKKQ
jgi:hypothetical protein